VYSLMHNNQRNPKQNSDKEKIARVHFADF
jgi:hypothetical protein